MPHPDEIFAPTLDYFPIEIRAAIVHAELPGLAAGPVATELVSLLKKSNWKLPPLAISGLWLLAGDLDRSHTLSQDDSSAAGSFWHAIMHRREGDYSNAAYWFRRVGSHRVIQHLSETYPQDYCDPYHFIDAVQSACRTKDAAAGAAGSRGVEAIDRLQQIQWTEWQRLMQDCLAV